MSQPIPIIPFFSACLLSLLTLQFGTVNGAGAKGVAPILLAGREHDGRRHDRVTLKTVGQRATIHISRSHGIDSRDLLLPPGWLKRGGKVHIVFANFPFLEGLTLSWRDRSLQTSLGESPRARLTNQSGTEEAVNIRLVKKGRDILFDVPDELLQDTGENRKDSKDRSQNSVLRVTWIDAYR